MQRFTLWPVVRIIIIFVYLTMMRIEVHTAWKVSYSNSMNWHSIASSSNGKYVYAVVNGGSIYASSDYGLHWNISLQNNRLWTSIATSSSGKYVYSCDNNTFSYFSINYGSSWNLTNGGVKCTVDS
jgi:hypothetical protein